MTYNRQRPFVYGRVGTIIKNLQKMIFGVGSYTQLLPFLKDKIDYVNEVGDGTNSDVVMAPVQWMMRTFPEAPIRMRTYDKDGEEEMIVDHKLLDLLSNPNESYPSETLWASTILSYAVDGNAYWLKVYSNSGKVVQLWWVPHTLISPVQPWELRDDESQFINYYRYTVPGRGDYYIDPDGVVHFRFGQDIENPRKGLSPLKSAVREIFSDQEAANWTAALLKNGAVPGLMVAPDPAGGGSGRVGDAALKATKTYLESQFTASNRGRPHVSSMPMKIEQFGFSPEQMDLKVVRRLPEERVSALLGIPAIVAGLGAGLDRSTFANMSEAREMAWESNVIPTQRIFAATLSMQLLRKDFMAKESGTPGRGNKRAPTEIYFDNSDVRVLQEDENNKVTRLNTGVKGGWIRVSEARREQNLATNEFDEVYLRNPAMIEVMADEPRPEPEPEVVEVEKPAPKKDSPPDADKADGGKKKWQEDYEKFQEFMRLASVEDTQDVLRRVDAKLGKSDEERYNEIRKRVEAELGVKSEVGQEAAQESGIKAQEAGGEVDDDGPENHSMDEEGGYNTHDRKSSGGYENTDDGRRYSENNTKRNARRGSQGTSGISGGVTNKFNENGRGVTTGDSIDGFDEGNPQGGSGGDERGVRSLETPSESHSPENKKVGTHDSPELPVRTSTSADENIGDGAGDVEGTGGNGGVGNKGNSEHGSGGTKGGGIDGAGLEQHDQGREALSSSGDRTSHSETDSGVLSGTVAGSDEDSGNKNGNVGTPDDNASEQGGRDNRHGTKGKGGGIDGTGQGQRNDSGGGSGGEDSGRGGDEHVEASSGNAEGLKNSTITTGGELDGDANINAKKAPDGDSGADAGESEKDDRRDFGNLEHEVKERTDDSRTNDGNDSESSGRGNKGIAGADADGHDEMENSGFDRGDGVSNREDSTRDEERKRTASADSYDSEREKRHYRNTWTCWIRRIR